MFRLGLTGSIATGKSTALQMFSDAGVPTLSADEVVHRLYQSEAVDPISERFPNAIAGGTVDRQKLSALVLSEPKALADLEAIVHPLVRKAFDRFEKQMAETGADLVVFDVPLLFEGTSHYELDGVAVTFCDPDEQRRRALLRPGMTDEKLDSILKRQMPQSEKRRRADFEIDTNRTFDDMRHQIKTIISACRRAKQPS